MSCTRLFHSLALMWLMSMFCCSSSATEWYPDPLNAGEWPSAMILAKSVVHAAVGSEPLDDLLSPFLASSATPSALMEVQTSSYAHEIMAQLEPPVASSTLSVTESPMRYRYVNNGYLVATEYDGFDCHGATDMIAHRLNRCRARYMGSEMVSLMVTRNSTTKAVTTTLIGHLFDDAICQAYASSYTVSSFDHFGRCRRSSESTSSSSTSVDIIRRSDEVVAAMSDRHRSHSHRHHDSGILRTTYQTADSCFRQRKKDILRFDYYHTQCRQAPNATTSSRYHCSASDGPVLLHFDAVDCQGDASTTVPLVATCSAKHSLYYVQYACLPAQKQ